VANETPLDLEIGVGNGEFLAHHASLHPERCVLGIERKFKPLVQSLKRAQRAELNNAALLRYQAGHLEDIFAPEELNNIYLFFPDPWPKTKHHKNRLVNDRFLKSTFTLQRANSRFEIKTDNDEYYEWILQFAKNSQYEIDAQTTDLHQSSLSVANYMTQFERLWTEKGLKTKYLRLSKL
jgi:tRNA (guanine-N7-)-methyltransferase